MRADGAWDAGQTGAASPGSPNTPLASTARSRGTPGGASARSPGGTPKMKFHFFSFQMQATP